MKVFRLTVVLLAALLFVPVSSARAESNTAAVLSVSKQSPAPLAPLTLPFSLTALAAVIGATAGPRKMNLSQTYLFNGEAFGPGNDIDVPEDFPDIDGETGAVIHPPGTPAARNAAASARVNAGAAPIQGRGPAAGEGARAPETAGVTVSGLTAEQLEELTKGDLVKIAEKAGIVVEREDGSEGEPLKADYVRVLGGTKTD